MFLKKKDKKASFEIIGVTLGWGLKPQLMFADKTILFNSRADFILYPEYFFGVIIKRRYKLCFVRIENLLKKQVIKMENKFQNLSCLVMAMIVEPLNKTRVVLNQHAK